MDNHRKFIDVLNSLKNVAALVAALAALVTAIAAFRKPTDTEPTRKAYEALAEDIRVLSKQVDQNHADSQALRDYVNGYIQGRAKHPEALASAAPPVSTRPHATGGGSGAGAGVGGGRISSPASADAVPPPAPPVAPRPPRVDPDPFDVTQLVKRTPD